MWTAHVPLLAVCALAAGPLLAQEGTPAPPTPPDELSQVTFLVGSWSCTGTMTGAPGTSPHATAAAVKGAMTLGGRWLHLTYDERKTAENPRPVSAGIYVGFDPARQRFLYGLVDSTGGYATETSPGWSGDTLTFEGDHHAGGGKVLARDVFTKKGATQVTHARLFQGKEGEFVPFEEETCTKRR